MLKKEGFAIKGRLKDSKLDVYNVLTNGWTDGKLFRLIQKAALLTVFEITHRKHHDFIDERTAKS